MPATSSTAFNKAMGRVLNRERKARGLTFEVLGKHLGVSYQQIGKYVSGLNGCSAHVLANFATALGVTVAHLYEQVGMPSPEQQPTEPAITAADNDAFLAARYVKRIADPKLRRCVIDFTQKLAYAGAAA